MSTRKYLSTIFMTMALAAPVWPQALEVEKAVEKAEMALQKMELVRPLELLTQKFGPEQAERFREQAERIREQAERIREQSDRSREQTDRGRERIDGYYQRGIECLDEAKWEKAVTAFDQVVKAAGQRADGALYWKAYALDREGQRDTALQELTALLKTYPSSRWLNDAKVLEAEIRQKSGQPVRPAVEGDEELKLMAINSLMNTDPESAVPILEKFLQSNNTPKLKDRALFVLAQSRSAKARDVIAQIARGKANPDLQLKALRYMVHYGGKDNRQTLTEIYGSSSDMAVKRTILRSFMETGDKERLFNAAKSESSAELRQEAIRLLGAQGARDELWQLYQAEASVDVKKDIMRSLFTTGASDKMSELARNEKDPTLRRSAIRNLGTMGGRKGHPAGNTGETLVAIYGTEKESDLKREVINALFIQNDAKALVDLARKESDPALKRELVNRLSIMHSKEATEYMMEILNK